MLKKLQVVAVLMCMFSYAVAGTVSIGTASARGGMRVDSFAVKGNTTLFDGSVVETGQTTADLRINKGAEITMSISSRGTLYSDRLVLQQGTSELLSSSAFQLEANGLRVSSNEPNSRAVVSLRAGNTVEVASLNGSFGVRNGQGILLASVRPGRALSFAMKAGASATSFEVTGMVSSENGHYYVTDSNDVKYELTGKNFKNFVGTKAVITGTVQGAAAQTAGSTLVISVSSIVINGLSAGIGTATSFLICGVVVGAGTGIGVAIDRYTQTSTPASR